MDVANTYFSTKKFDIVIENDGAIVVAFNDMGTVSVEKFNPMGQSLWKKSFKTDRFSSIKLLKKMDGDFLLALHINRSNSDDQPVPAIIAIPDPDAPSHVFSFNDGRPIRVYNGESSHWLHWETIAMYSQIRIYDLQGVLKHVESGYSNTDFKLDNHQYSRGIYFYELEIDAALYRGKFVKL
jgi:hypothetical protein